MNKCKECGGLKICRCEPDTDDSQYDVVPRVGMATLERSSMSHPEIDALVWVEKKKRWWLD